MKIFKSLIFYLLILIFFLAFNMSDSPPPPSGWYQQFMPPINNRPISDITFLDSLTGFAVTPYTANDTAYILKTTNGGDIWNILFKQPTNTVGGFNRVQFLNLNTGYTCGNFLWKTTNGGLNWSQQNTSGIFPESMFVLNQDTIWIIDSESLTGGVFRTTNGGASWVRQLQLGSQNPNHIYMYNGRLGFIAKDGDYLRRTTNSGINWIVDTVGNGSGFRDIYFADSLTGWKTWFNIKKTTNGGLNWFDQTTAQGGIIQTSFIYRFSNVNKDTIWGVGGYALYPNNQLRGLVHRTTNGGTNWLFQIPDTSIHIGSYGFCDFVNRNDGWAYVGIHTTTGGDPTWYTGVQQTPNAVPEEFELKQNYPNPFNPRTVIPYSLSASAHVKIIAYDITGREVQRMVDSYQQAGAYEVDFMGKFTASGVYFYRMTVDDKLVGTRKMILIK